MIKDEINALKSKDLFELRLTYKRYFGRDGVAGNREFYISRIAYRMQEIHYGGLPSSIRFLIENMKVAKDNSKGGLTIGSSILKDYKGKLYGMRLLRLSKRMRALHRLKRWPCLTVAGVVISQTSMPKKSAPTALPRLLSER